MLSYDTYVTEVALLSQFNTNDPFFVSNLPSCIDYATDRITRELDLLNTITTNSSIALTVGTRTVSLSSLNPVFNVLRDINVLTPVGTTNPDLGMRNPLTISTVAFLNQVYGADSGTGVPEYFAMLTDQSIVVGPFPDQAYNIEIIGTVRPTPISATNQTNWISTYLPDLLIAASMVQMSGVKGNYGAQADDPKMAMSWENQYVTLRDSAAVEDAMRKYASTGWNSQLPTAYNPART